MLTYKISMLLFAFNMCLDILRFKLNLLNFIKFKLYKLLYFAKLDLFLTYGFILKTSHMKITISCFWASVQRTVCISTWDSVRATGMLLTITLNNRQNWNCLGQTRTPSPYQRACSFKAFKVNSYTYKVYTYIKLIYLFIQHILNS